MTQTESENSKVKFRDVQTGCYYKVYDKKGWCIIKVNRVREGGVLQGYNIDTMRHDGKIRYCGIESAVGINERYIVDASRSDIRWLKSCIQNNRLMLQPKQLEQYEIY